VSLAGGIPPLKACDGETVAIRENVNTMLAVWVGTVDCDGVAGGARRQVLTEAIPIACEAVTVFSTILLHTSRQLDDGADPDTNVL
jgi:hypothetical protein